jgi:replicative DNA helicase
VTSEDEKAILINMITSTRFLKEVYTIAKKEYFTIPYAHHVLDWINEYFATYSEAPNKHIQDLYNVYRANLSSEETSLVAMFLQDLSDKYDESFNEMYAVDKALLYFRKRALEHSNEQIKSLLTLDRIEDAEKVMTQYKQVLKDTSKCVNPNDPDYIDKVFNEERDKDRLIKFPGVLGELLGWFCRGYLVVVQAPFKMGKTHTLDECRMLAAKNRLKSVGFNFEMTEEQLAERYWQRITASPRPDNENETLYPYFDCLYNQIGTCELDCRTNHVRLYKPSQTRPTDFSKTPVDYHPCDACRSKDRENYKQAIWFRKIERPMMSPETVKKKATTLVRNYGDFTRIKCFARGAANVDDIKNTLDILEFSEGFIPDVITVDYATIMGAEREAEGGNEESKLDKTLLKLAGLATERHCLVVTASQVKTEVLKKSSTRMGDASQSSRAIYAHPTIVIGIMQTSEEKMYGAKRMNCIAHRFANFNPIREVLVLQQLDTGQVILDSDWASIEK